MILLRIIPALVSLISFEIVTWHDTDNATSSIARLALMILFGISVYRMREALDRG